MFAAEPITVINYAITQQGGGAYGGDQRTATTVTVQGLFAPAPGYESTTGSRDQVVAQPHAYLPFGTPVTPQSELLIRGEKYEVDGRPQPWTWPSSSQGAGIDVPLKITGG